MTAATHTGEPVLAWLARRSESARQKRSRISTTPSSSTVACSARFGAPSCSSWSRRRRRDRCAAHWQRPDTGDEGAGAGHDGDGDHLLHGHDLRGAPQPRGHARLRRAGQLPVATSARLHRGRGPRSDPGIGLPAAGLRRHPQRRHRARRGRFGRDCGPDGGGADPRSRQRHPRHRRRRPQRRVQWRDRRRRVYRPGVGLGRPGLRRIDESGPLARPDARRWRPHALLGLSRRPDRRRDDRGRVRVDPSRAGRPRPGPMPRRASSTRIPAGSDRLDRVAGLFA